MNILGNNAAGILNKLESFKRHVNKFQPSVYFVQETKCRKKNKLKHPDYVIFEHVRKNSAGGGLLTAVHKNLKPVSVSEETEVEILVVEGKVNNKSVRFINGYGPQDESNSTEEEKREFFSRLDVEVKSSRMVGAMICIHMDANSKLGPTLIPNDPHSQSPNGRILAGIIERNLLMVGNSLVEKCTGLITRKRTTIDATEESVIDFVLFSRDLVEKVESIIIDEERRRVLTKYMKTKNGTKRMESDQNPIITKLNLKWIKSFKKERNEIFNLKNKECQNTFREITSGNNFLSSVFDDCGDINAATNKFLKRLDGCLHKSFNKIRITDRPNKKLEELFNRRKVLRAKSDERSKSELEKVEGELAMICAKENKELIEKELEGIDCEEGGTHSGRLWKLRKKLFPKSREPPTAMLDQMMKF